MAKYILCFVVCKHSEGNKIVILIAGAPHTGKTRLAQGLLEKYRYPYLSIDHLKMGRIRSGATALTPCDDEKMTAYLWQIVREMIKMVIENEQNLIVEVCYIPFDWENDFGASYRSQMKWFCLVMSESYIRNHFEQIKKYANVAEKRLADSDCTQQKVISYNAHNLAMCRKCHLDYQLIDEKYDIDVRL